MAVDFKELKREDCRTVARRLGLELNGQDKARCFLHAGDKNPSLQVYADGWKCFGCGEHGDGIDLVAKYLNIPNTEAAEWMKKVFHVQEPPRKQDYGKAEREHIYPGGQIKKVMYRRADASKYACWFHMEGGTWKKGRGTAPHSLYIAGELAGAVFVAEGEKDCDNLHKLGYNAASGEDGAGRGKWRPEYTEQLKGLPICIFQDNDKIGKDYAQETAAALHGVASSVQVLDLSQVWPKVPEKGDISDLIAQFGPEKSCDMIAQLISTTPEWEASCDQNRPTLETITAADLQQKDLPSIKFIVDRLLSVGLNILASPPKYGKSWMVLALCLAVASGGRFLGYTTNQCGCLYLALEDSQRRLKTRMNKLLAGKAAPGGFHFATMASPIDNGLFDELEDFLKKHPDTGLIVVDTLQRVRGASHGKEGAYAADYREVGALKAFADQHNVALLLVHHLRKMKDDGDPFNMISGTNGIMGAADTTMVLTKEKRGDSNATFSVVGRDVESSDTVLRFNKDTCYWENLGDADWFAEQQARQEYQESPLVKTIKKLVEQSPEGWEGTAQQLLEAGRFIARTSLANSPKALSNKLRDMANLLLDNDGIVYERKSNGSGGGKHRFYSNTIPQFEELEQAQFDPFFGG
ncbi:AAA family ATPase [Flavonifractor plautii]|uniref:AAA family ATPase n=1 Tax=Flavonifractor plautii TaxID=292800 RepID=A0AAW6BWX9_FLAPL|nr:AAA family ATPase [Flavonifractor plautii]MDB7887078.1 AAA family ATPase [Flavonifractor plautii]MDB7904712.1 AAA family ATPase [Flavonifractor plautii]